MAGDEDGFRIFDGILMIQPRGPMTAERFLNLSERIAGLPEFRSNLPRLWDLTQASPGDLGRVSDLIVKINELINEEQGKTAFVVLSDLGYGLSRSAAGWAASTEREYRVFRGPSTDAAMSWLCDKDQSDSDLRQ